MSLRELLFQSEMSETERLAVLIKIEATEGKPQRDFVLAMVNEWLQSSELKDMHIAQRYFRNKNDILERKRFVIGRLGVPTESKTLANNRKPHNFLRKLVKQKVGYLLSNPFTTKTDNETYGKALGDYITTEFYSLIKNTGQDAVVNGIGWLQAYYTETGELGFKRLPPTEIIPFWGDIDHKVLDAAIRVYDMEVYTEGEQKTVRHVKYFTRDVIFNYLLGDDGLSLDMDAPLEYNFGIVPSAEIEGDMVTGDQENVMWNRLPLIAFKYNTEELSLLNFIKELIDDYDKRDSDLSNDLEDEPNRIKVIRDYDGTDKDEFNHNLAQYRMLFLRGTGSCDTLDNSMDVNALALNLDRTRRDIFEFGGGVDTQNKDIGNSSGVALKFLYSDLDMDASDFATEISWALRQCFWFVSQDLLLRGMGDFTGEDVKIAFGTDITINEAETVDIIAKSRGIISDATLIANHPYVVDASKEQEQIEREQREQSEMIQDTLNETNPTVEEGVDDDLHNRR